MRDNHVLSSGYNQLNFLETSQANINQNDSVDSLMKYKSNERVENPNESFDH
jgi:hypothetical protein